MSEQMRERVYRFDDFEIDVGRSCLRRSGHEVHLRRKAFDVLVVLVSRRGLAASKQELIDACWSGAAVTDDTLVQCIGHIRRALGDEAEEPTYVRTVPKLGYRFLAEVQEVAALRVDETRLDEQPPTPQADPPSQEPAMPSCGRRGLASLQLCSVRAGCCR
jgi:DNA-binding winged helix-turn-helix (wHTH) protein